MYDDGIGLLFTCCMERTIHQKSNDMDGMGFRAWFYVRYCRYIYNVSHLSNKIPPHLPFRSRVFCFGNNAASSDMGIVEHQTHWKMWRVLYQILNCSLGNMAISIHKWNYNRYSIKIIHRLGFLPTFFKAKNRKSYRSICDKRLTLTIIYLYTKI